MAASPLIRAELDKGLNRAGTNGSDGGWSAWMRDVEHPKRSMIVYLIVSLAAADFWKQAKSMPNDPFKNTNSDVLVAEALVFFWNSFFTFVRRAVEAKELVEADNQAVFNAGVAVGRVIEEMTRWPIGELLGSRMDEYQYRDATENPTEVFSRVVLRCIGKQAISDDDRCLDPLSSSSYMPIIMQTMIHMTTMLPAYFKTYKNIIHQYPMD